MAIKILLSVGSIISLKKDCHKMCDHQKNSKTQRLFCGHQNYTKWWSHYFAAERLPQNMWSSKNFYVLDRRRFLWPPKIYSVLKTSFCSRKTATKCVLKALFCCRKTATKCVIIKKFLCLRLKEVFWAPRKNKVFWPSKFY